MRDEPRDQPLDAATTELLGRAARAARELCELLWETLRQELRAPREERVRELSERIAEVSSTVAMLAAGPGVGSPQGGTPPGPPGGGRGMPRAGTPPEPPGGESRMPQDGTRPEPSGGERRTPPEPIWAERRTPPEPAGPPPPPPAPHPAALARRAAEEEPARMRLVDEHEQSSTAPEGREPSIATAPAPAPGSIATAGVRPEQGASAWVNTVGRLLARHAVDGLPFAVLLVELVDIARIEHSEPPEEVTRLVVQVEGALARAMREPDELTRESLGRYWLAAPETNGTGARMLAERLALLVRDSVTHRGVPLEVAIGIAVCPEDGVEAPELAARADLSVYSARATGRSVARTEPPA